MKISKMYKYFVINLMDRLAVRVLYPYQGAFVLITMLMLFSRLIYCQSSLSKNIKGLEGIWIAEDYLYSFSKTKSTIQSIRSFDQNNPVGLRVNTSEMEHGVLSIGYGALHDHFIHPEVSKYIVINSDTFPEQGNFYINLEKSDSLNFYKISEIAYFNYECKSYFSWIISNNDTLLILYRPATSEQEAQVIKYKRIIRSFKADYPFPNPIYYYTRSETLVGTYTLKDSTGQIISSNFQIDFDGKTMGYSPFQNKTLYFSTDICGLQLDEEYVLLCSFNEKLEPDCDGLIYKCLNKKTIQLHETIWVEDQDGYKEPMVGKMKYQLIRK